MRKDSILRQVLDDVSFSLRFRATREGTFVVEPWGNWPGAGWVGAEFVDFNEALDCAVEMLKNGTIGAKDEQQRR